VDAVQTASVNDAADIERSRTLDVASGKDGGNLAGAKRRHPD
jgi:hypothetical protein